MEQIQTALNKAKERYGKPMQALLMEAACEVRTSDGHGKANADLCWSMLPAADIRLARLSRKRIVTADRSDPAHFAFDRLRTKLIYEMRQRNFTSVAITSPRPGCGKSVVTLNLAFSLGHQGDCRSLVFDLDLGRPSMAEILGLGQAVAMEDFLAGRLPVQAALVRHGHNLAFGANGRASPDSAELLHSDRAARVLATACGELQPDIVVYDIPPMLGSDHVMGFLPHVDCVILVVAAEASTRDEIDLCERELADKSNLLGVVLNKCRYPNETYGYPVRP